MKLAVNILTIGSFKKNETLLLNLINLLQASSFN